MRFGCEEEYEKLDVRSIILKTFFLFFFSMENYSTHKKFKYAVN